MSNVLVSLKKILLIKRKRVSQVLIAITVLVATRWMETAILVGEAGHVHARLTKNSRGGEWTWETWS